MFASPNNMNRDTAKRNLLHEIAEYGETRIAQMETIWEHLFGLHQTAFDARYSTIKQHVKSMFDDMLEEENQLLVEHQTKLSDLIACKRSLEEELCTTIELPFEADATGPNLIKQIEDLADCLKKYETVRMMRLKELVTLKEAEERLCDILGEELEYVSVATVPSENLLAEIRDRVKSLEAEKIERSNIRVNLIFEIEELIVDMELEENDLNEATMLRPDDTRLVLTKASLNALQELKSHLVSAKKTQIDEIVTLKEKTLLLWDLLDVDPEERTTILTQTIKGYGQRVVNIWKSELQRCETLKAINIQKVIVRLRDAIKQLWDDCHISEEERKSFIYFNSENYNEQLLEEHEKERERLRLYHDERKPIFVQAKKWFGLWNKMILLEDQANGDTNRFANRGGQLLKEERERKAVQKELPKVESNLEKMVTEIERKTRTPFIYNGRPLLKTIAEMWEKRRIDKENEKEIRKTQSRGTTPLKTNNNALRTPASSIKKRGEVLAPIVNGSARRELKMPPMSAKKQIRRRSKSHDPCDRYRDENANADVEVSVGSYNGFKMNGVHEV